MYFFLEIMKANFKIDYLCQSIARNGKVSWFPITKKLLRNSRVGSGVDVSKKLEYTQCGEILS